MQYIIYGKREIWEREMSWEALREIKLGIVENTKILFKHWFWKNLMEHEIELMYVKM